MLTKIYNLFYSDESATNKKDIPSYCISEDWFFQPGKVYSDSSKSLFTKYTNLHLGRAWDVMTAKEYYELTGNGMVSDSTGTTYTKPEIGEFANLDSLKEYMMNRGRLALEDAFSVLRAKKVFNIYNP